MHVYVHTECLQVPYFSMKRQRSAQAYEAITFRHPNTTAYRLFVDSQELPMLCATKMMCMLLLTECSTIDSRDCQQPIHMNIYRSRP